jgi:hypothetical protein
MFVFLFLLVVPAVVGNIPCSRLILTTHLLASESEIVFSLISKVGNALGLLAFSFDFADLGSDFVAEIK